MPWLIGLHLLALACILSIYPYMRAHVTLLRSLFLFCFPRNSQIASRWNVETGHKQRIFPSAKRFGPSIFSVAISDDGAVAAWAGADKKVTHVLRLKFAVLYKLL